MDNLWMVVLAMGAVTYIPRMLPMVLLQNIQLPPFLDRFFQFIPYAALGALIFPGIIYSTGSTASAIAGSITAVGLALFRVNIIVVVLGAILGVIGWELLIQF